MRCIHRRAYCSLSDAEMLGQVDAPPANVYLSVARLQFFGRLVRFGAPVLWALAQPTSWQD
eukprot:14016115-Alexandrium_andersonii.AAC.1